MGVRVSSSSLKTHKELCWEFSFKIDINESLAEIAQLVEHNLAKVGVASSSLVFRSLFRHSFFHSIRVSEVVRFLVHFFCQLLTKSNIKSVPEGYVAS